MLVTTQGNYFRPVGDLTTATTAPDFPDHLVIQTNTGRLPRSPRLIFGQSLSRSETRMSRSATLLIRFD